MDIGVVNLLYIKDTIEHMTKPHQIEILRILKKTPNIKLNENKSGVYINLSFLPNNTLDDIIKYIKYIQEQEKTLQQAESQKDDFKSTFFTEHEINP